MSLNIQNDLLGSVHLSQYVDHLVPSRFNLSRSFSLSKYPINLMNTIKKYLDRHLS